jgi:GrpB-like predicted nucleotidyltransferase (UPF0157 family)
MANVVVVPYSDQWPERFGILQTELIALFAPDSIAVEHIGSTSVPGLAAKPVIDVLIGAPSLAQIESKIKLLGEHGYEYVSKYEVDIPERRYFVKVQVCLPNSSRAEIPATALRVHVHAVELASRIWCEHLVFRDALRNDALLRARYQTLKLQLAKEFANNKSAYSNAKNPFVEAVIADVLRSA